MNTMLDFDKIKLNSIGRWPGIYAALGINVGEGRHCSCPSCGGKDRFRFTDLDGKGVYICNQCGSGDGFDLVQKVMKLDFTGACEAVERVLGIAKINPLTQEKKANPEDFRKMLESSKKVKNNDPVHRYLKERGLKELPSTLWHCPKCWNTDKKQNYDAMLAVFSDPKGEAVTIHRTYIMNGKKADVPNPKKIMTPLKKMNGGSVRLYPGKPEVIGVCEGIETAIAVHELYGVIVWPCLSAQLLQDWEPPDFVHTVRIYSDNDWNYTGQKAAYILANKLSLKPYELKVVVYVAKNNDFLDDLNMGIK